MTRDDKRLMIFIDGSNIFWAQTRFKKGFRIDYLKLVDNLKDKYDLIRTYYYASTKVPPIKQQTEFYEALQRLGIRVITKPLRRGREKGVDVALVSDFIALGFRNAFDIAIIVSGDQDYVNAIKEVQALGKMVQVASFRKSFGKDLYGCCDKILFIDDIVNKIERKKS